jgi:hypothetical protein
VSEARGWRAGWEVGVGKGAVEVGRWDHSLMHVRAARGGARR